MEAKLRLYWTEAGNKPEFQKRILIMQDRDNVEGDAHQCKYCTDLCYLSMIKCIEHTVSPI